MVLAQAVAQLRQQWVVCDLRQIGNVDTLGMALSAGIGPGAERLVRLNHTGRRACLETVLGSVLAYGIALKKRGFPADLAAAGAAVAARYAD